MDGADLQRAADFPIGGDARLPRMVDREIQVQRLEHQLIGHNGPRLRRRDGQVGTRELALGRIEGERQVLQNVGRQRAQAGRQGLRKVVAAEQAADRVERVDGLGAARGERPRPLPDRQRDIGADLEARAEIDRALDQAGSLQDTLLVAHHVQVEIERVQLDHAIDDLPHRARCVGRHGAEREGERREAGAVRIQAHQHRPELEHVQRADGIRQCRTERDPGEPRQKIRQLADRHPGAGHQAHAPAGARYRQIHGQGQRHAVDRHLALRAEVDGLVRHQVLLVGGNGVFGVKRQQVGTEIQGRQDGGRQAEIRQRRGDDQRLDRLLIAVQRLRRPRGLQRGRYAADQLRQRIERPLRGLEAAPHIEPLGIPPLRIGEAGQHQAGRRRGVLHVADRGEPGLRQQRKSLVEAPSIVGPDRHRHDEGAGGGIQAEYRMQAGLIQAEGAAAAGPRQRDRLRDRVAVERQAVAQERHRRRHERLRQDGEDGAAVGAERRLVQGHIAARRRAMRGVQPVVERLQDGLEGGECQFSHRCSTNGSRVGHRAGVTAGRSPGYRGGRGPGCRGRCGKARCRRTGRLRAQPCR